jgi:signal transduction histidine kinase
VSTVFPLPASAERGTLHELSRALSSARSLEAAGSAASACLQATLGPTDLVALSRIDGSGRLRVEWHDAQADVAVRLARPAKREEALRTLRPLRVRPRSRSDRLVALLPLSCGGEPSGVLEVHAPADRVDEAWEVLEGVAAQLGLALRGIAQAELLRRQGDQLDRALAAVAALTPGVDADAVADERDLAIAWAAHELRGPISALTASLGFLREQGSSDDSRLLDRCLRELDHMSRLVDATLHPSTVDGPAPGGDCDVVEVARRSIEQSELELRDHRVSLRAPDRAAARIDPVQLRSAISNLVRNALAYSPSGSQVEVLVTNEPEVVSITVRNAGRATPGTDGAPIFLPYVRGANSGGRNGVGLGLFIARRVAEMNEGRLILRLHDEETEFLLEVPRGAPR